jgi:predicted RNase H-like HicB family nuclease
LYVADCPELEIADQGKTIELALKSLREAIELYLRDEDAKIPEVDYRPMVTVVKVVRGCGSSQLSRAVRSLGSSQRLVLRNDGLDLCCECGLVS